MIIYTMNNVLWWKKQNKKIAYYSSGMVLGGAGGWERGVLDFFIKNNHVHRLEIFFVSNISTWVLVICLFARSI
jgi:hypothetical protein